MANKLTTIYIDDTSIRLLVTKGNAPKSWASMSLKQGLVDGLNINNVAKVSEKLAQLVKKHKISSRNVTLGISGVNCLTRQLTMPALPRNMIGEAVIHEARRLLPLPLEELYLSWQIVPSPQGKTIVILVGLRRASIDPLLQVLKLARLKVQNLTIKPLAMARLIKDKNALLVDVQSSEFDVVVLWDGIPQPIRTLSFSSAGLTWEEKSQIITEEIDRTIKFFNANNSGNLLDTNGVMYASGELAEQPELCNQISEQFGFKIETLDVTPPRDTDFLPNYYVVNIGLAAQQPTSGSDIKRLNLLPLTYRPNQINWSRALAIPAIAVFCGVILTLTLLVTSTSNNIALAQDQLDATNKILQEKQIEKQTLKKQITDLEDSLTTINNSINVHTQFLDILTKQANVTNIDLQTAINNFPDSVSMINLSLDNKTLMIQGKALDETPILTYAKALEQTGYFSETVISNIKLGDGTDSYEITLLK